MNRKENNKEAETNVRILNEWVLGLVFFIETFVSMHFDKYAYLKIKPSKLLAADIKELVINTILIIFLLIYDYLKIKNINVSIWEFYMSWNFFDESIRLLIFITVLGCIFNILQDIHRLDFLTNADVYNLYGLVLILLVIYLICLAKKIKIRNWSDLSDDEEIINWNLLVQNEKLDKYKGEVILLKLIKRFDLNNKELVISANKYFDYYCEFIDKLQTLSTDELIKLKNFLKISDRVSYKWRLKNFLSSNLKTIVVAIITSYLSYSTIVQITSGINNIIILQSLGLIENYIIFGYVAMVIVYYVGKIVLYEIFIPYQRKIRNRNIEHFLISTIQSVLEIRNVSHR